MVAHGINSTEFCLPQCYKERLRGKQTGSLTGLELPQSAQGRQVQNCQEGLQQVSLLWQLSGRGALLAGTWDGSTSQAERIGCERSQKLGHALHTIDVGLQCYHDGPASSILHIVTAACRPGCFMDQCIMMCGIEINAASYLRVLQNINMHTFPQKGMQEGALFFKALCIHPGMTDHDGWSQ